MAAAKSVILFTFILFLVLQLNMDSVAASRKANEQLQFHYRLSSKSRILNIEESQPLSTTTTRRSLSSRGSRNKQILHVSPEKQKFLVQFHHSRCVQEKAQKDVLKNPGGCYEGQGPNKHEKLGKAATAKASLLPMKNMFSSSQNLAVPSENYAMLKYSMQELHELIVTRKKER
ncbi:hypothetical protein K1719_046805 [Acacia pycnantha]|nr:hypothetical protein K1719_046805 [Acacia pycnantha]